MIKRSKPDTNFTVIANEVLCDERLSLAARGLLAMLLSKPADWEVSVGWLTLHCDLGRDAIYGRLNELRACGYAHAVRERRLDGTLGGSGWVVYDSPRAETPETADTTPNTPKPELAEPTLAEATTIKERTIQKKDNKNIDSSYELSVETPPEGDSPDGLGGKNKVYLSIAEKVFGLLNKKTGKNFRARRPNGKPTAGALKAIQLLKDGYTEGDLRVVVARKASDWTTPQKRDEMQCYLTPETLFRPSKFEKYLGECVAP